MQVSIRNIEESDRSLYLQFADTFYNSSACLHTVPAENFEKSFNFMLHSKVYAELFMIECDDEVIGYCMISKTYSQEAASMVLLVEELYIVEEHRSKGVATKVFKYLFDKYGKFGRIRLEVVEDNYRARKLYERLGFEYLNYMQMIIDRWNIKNIAMIKKVAIFFVKDLIFKKKCSITLLGG